MDNLDLKEEKINLRVDLKGDYVKMLTSIRDEGNFRSFTETIRFCISQTFSRPIYHIEENFINKITRLLNYYVVTTELGITNHQAFINKALEYYFDKIKQMNMSIKNFDVRVTLNEEELEVALAILHCQQNNYLEEVTIDDLLKYMNKRNSKKIKEIISNFVEKGILSVLNTKKGPVYHAQ